MRDLTLIELDAELAEQLPARELMGKSGGGGCGCGGGDWTNGSYNGNTSHGIGILNGNLNGNTVVVFGGGRPL
jgi:hypothetical protein